jgi:hypothetical protein
MVDHLFTLSIKGNLLKTEIKWLKLMEGYKTAKTGYQDINKNHATRSPPHLSLHPLVFSLGSSSEEEAMEVRMS